MRQKHLALVVDDQECSLDHVRPVLRSLGHEFHFAQTQAEAEALLDQHRYCYVLLDLEFPADEDCVARVETGFNLLADLRTRFDRRELPVIIMTAHEKGSEYQVRALQLDANDFASKASDKNFETLDVKVRRVVEQTCGKDGCCSLGLSRSGEARRGATRLHFLGDCKNRRYRMGVNEREVWVCYSTFTLLWKLTSAAYDGGRGWVAGRVLSAGNYHNALSRAKRDLAKVAGVSEGLVEGDGHGSFRLALPQEDVSFDEALMEQQHAGLLSAYPVVLKARV